MNRFGAINISNLTEGADTIDEFIKEFEGDNEDYVIFEIVRIVTHDPTISIPAWDSEKQPAPAPDAYKVGQPCEVYWRNIDGSRTWCSAVIKRVDDKKGAPYYAELAGEHATWFYSSEVRRPVTAAASAPVAVAREFEFGERVQVGKDVNKNSHPNAGSFVFAGVEPTGNYAILVEKYRYTIYFKPDQVWHID